MGSQHCILSGSKQRKVMKRKEKSEGKRLICKVNMIGEIISLADSEKTMFLLNQEHKLLQNISVIIVI